MQQPQVLSLFATSPVLSPEGEPMFQVGGPNSWRTHSYRGFHVAFEWRRMGRHLRKCLMIWPETNVFVKNPRMGCWCITDRVIGEFVGFTKEGKCTGSASLVLYREAREALLQMGKDRNDKQAHSALVDVVIKYAPDLVMMPPAPRALLKRSEAEIPKLWDLTLKDKNTGKVLNEAEA